VGGRGEAAHVGPEFGEDLLGAAAGDAGDGIEPLKFPRERARLLLDPGVEEGDLLVPGTRCG
jgi:hypothetical protein